MFTVRLATGLLAVLASGAAKAHAILLESRPGPAATLPAGAQRVVLRFNCRIDHGRSRLVLESGGAEARLAIDPASAADSLAADVRLAAGAQKLRWQVLAVDGHITRGDLRFTVTG